MSVRVVACLIMLMVCGVSTGICAHAQGKISAASQTTSGATQPTTDQAPKANASSSEVGLLSDWGFWQTAIAAVALIGGAIAGAVRWLGGMSSHVRNAVSSSAADLRLTVGNYTLGGSFGVHANIHNAGPGVAHELSLHISGHDRPVWQSARLAPNDRVNPQVPIPDTSPLRSQQLTEPKVVLEYKDRYGLSYRRVLAVTQTRRDDGLFNFGTTGQPVEESPALGWREVWKLRKAV